ncbi:MAG: DUF1566 domain-containing protein [Lentisphaerae bacterium]|nr:DUF1566 domain-containing protein [Lentisphaerota bacterium]
MKQIALAGVFLVGVIRVAVAYETLQGPTETRYWDESRAWNGYTLFGARGTSYLIDMEGLVVNTWPVGTNPRFLDNGNLLDASTDDPSHGAGFIELDWAGNTVWEYHEDRDDYEPHHDFVRIFNTNLNAWTTLYIANKTITHAQAIAAGCNPANGPYDGAQADAVVEVDMSGNVVWEWWFFDHTVQDFDPTKSNYVAAISNAPGRIDVNLPSRPVKKDWLHCNSLDYNSELDQIVINSVQGEFYVIDHGGTFVAGNPAAGIALAASSAGDFLYRFGDPARYEQGDAPYIQEDWTQSSAGHKQIGGAHDIQWIKPGLPGAGHFLIFNNGQYLWERCPQSYIFEINGFLNAAGVDTGDYVNPPNAGYTIVSSPNNDTHKQKKNVSKQIAWQYYSKSNHGFFSHIGSGAQRLPNTNTLICAMTEGHIFEITSDGELVWEYVNPVTPDGKLERLDDNWPMYNSMFRAYRYTADHPALAGRDLTPGDTISGATPEYTYIPDTNDVPVTVTNAWSMLKLPDTGQTGDYTATYGEDSDYAVNPPAYTVNGDGGVSDAVTGLMWQRTDGGEMTWAAAVAYATNLALGSHNDWRLPTSHELFSIVNHGRASPALDTNAFTATAAQYWWSSDAQADDPSRIWAVNAGGGIGAHPTNETVSAGGSKRFHVRCVRDASDIAASNLHAFTVNGDGTVADRNTGLVWQQAQAPSALTWEAALTYAEQLALGGKSDWRLPNVKELRSISDDTLSAPSLDSTAFPGATAALFWSSTTEANQTNRAWTVDFTYGLVSYAPKTNACYVRCVRGGTTNAAVSVPVLLALAGGSYDMGDHHDLGGGEHANDEIPVHTVQVDAFQIAEYETRCDEYVEFLNSALQLAAIEVQTGLVYRAGTGDVYCETRAAVAHSRIGWDGANFSVLDGRGAHPATGIRWLGAAAYCNWLSEQTGRTPCYDLATGVCDFTHDGFRLPTEAEWEFAGRGGQYAPYRIYPWGDEADNSRANWPASGDPYEAGDLPLTTPTGFYDGSLRPKADFGWPAETNVYQTVSGANAYGLFDMAGNVWEWVNDWYGRDYYAYCVSNSVVTNPPGPVAGTPAPDGLPYHALRGGNWYNGEQGHSRVSNRNLAYYRGPDDPNHAWYHVGFRVALGARAATSNAPPVISGVSRSPLSPTSVDDVWVTATVTDDQSVAAVTLTYDDGSATGTTERTAFLETMAATAAKPWTGGGADNAWTVTAATASHIEQRTGANYGSSNPCGVEFHVGTANLTDTMIATTAGIDATGTSGYVEFLLQALTLTNSQGWTFQVDAGAGYATRLSELTGSSHAWQQYHYDLAPSERVGSLRLRFQFRGGTGDPRVDIDQISVKVTSVGGGGGSATVPMYDDGVHGDGDGGDGRYGGQIPDGPAGTTVRYYVTATDGDGTTTTDPAGAPAATYSYTVRTEVTNRTVGLITNTVTAFEGYTLMAPKHYTNTYLINNEGQMVHSWTSAYVPGQSAYLLTNGNLLRSCFIQGGGLTGGGEGGRIEEYAWDGSRVWELDYATANYAQHHDLCPLPNGSILMLVVERKTYAEVLQAGFNPSLLHPDVQGKNYMMPDSVVEVQPTRPTGGTVVWTWHVWDHLIQDYDATKSNHGVVANHPELVDVNGWAESGAIMPFWNHMNSIAYNHALDQIVLSVRGSSELWVIDHSTTTAQAASHSGGRSGKGGDLLYRWGNPVTYDALGSQMLFDQHDVQWIAAGCPGTGNMLVFNNGIGRNYSSVDEIVPPAIDASGNYARVAGQAYAPPGLTWTYAATPATSMYSEAISGCQRLPNGNTLICDGTHGELREVTPAGQVVWFYTCPVENTGPMTQGDTPSLDIRNHQYNAVFKVRRYPATYAGLQGKDLTPRGTIEIYPGSVADADGDAMSDVWEIAHFGSTTNAGALTDSDGDDLTDLDEYQRGIRPDLADTDGDTAPDGWEVANALDPAYAADGLMDSDGDGMKNADEYVADTGPWNPLSLLAITDLDAVSVDIRLTWIGGARAQQHLECSSNLVSGQWSAIFTNLPPTETTNSVIQAGAATGGNRFYRIKATR